MTSQKTLNYVTLMHTAVAWYRTHVNDKWRLYKNNTQLFEIKKIIGRSVTQQLQCYLEVKCALQNQTMHRTDTIQATVRTLMHINQCRNNNKLILTVRHSI